MSAFTRSNTATDFPVNTSARPSNPNAARFSRITATAARFFSTNTHRLAPRLSASIPTAPVPAERLGDHNVPEQPL